MCRKESPVASAGEISDFWQPVDDWRQLQARHVEILRSGSIFDSGRVDAVTNDGSVLWLAPDGAATRRLIVKQDGVHVKLLKTVGRSR